VEALKLRHKGDLRRSGMTEGINVPTLSIVSIGIVIVFAFAIPALLFIFFRNKFGCTKKPFFFACATFFIFAIVLEGIFHTIILANGRAELLQQKPLLYSLYGGFMAGLFEETGRFLTFKLLLKKNKEDDYTALSYGAGHGGFEAFYLLFVPMITNIFFAFLINSGNTSLITAKLDPEKLTEIEAIFSFLTTSKPYSFLLSIIERFAAIAIHLSLSVIVYFAAKEKKKTYLYPFAILIHMLIDMILAYCSLIKINTLLIELLVYLMAFISLALAYFIWRKNHTIKK